MDFLKALGIGQKRCHYCGAPFFYEDRPSWFGNCGLCPQCLNLLLPYKGDTCIYCGLPLAKDSMPARSSPGPVCQACESDRPPWQGRAFHGLYADNLRELLLRFKFGQDLALSALLGAFLAQAAVCLPKPDLVVAIPQHPAHLRKRGFNQARELARALGKLTGFRIASGILRRVRQNAPQEHLTAMERKKNLAGAFAAEKGLHNKSVWLVDDVVTTGSTCREAANTLLAAGAKAVYLLFVARTPL